MSDWDIVKKWTWARVKTIGRVFVILCALFGAYTGFHFYFAPTGLISTATHKALHRAELIDWVIGYELSKRDK